MEAYNTLSGITPDDESEIDEDYDMENIEETESIYQPDGSVSILSINSQKPSELPWSSSFSVGSAVDSLSIPQYCYDDEMDDSIMEPNEDYSVFSAPNDEMAQQDQQTLQIPKGDDNDESDTAASSHPSDEGRENKLKTKDFDKRKKMLTMLFTVAFMLIVSASFISYLLRRYAANDESLLGRPPSLPSVTPDGPADSPVASPSADSSKYREPLKTLLEDKAGIQFEQNNNALRALDWLAADLIKFDSEEGNILMEDEARLTQRFTLLVLGYSMFKSGLLFEYLNEDTDYLGENECDWPGVACSEEKDLTTTVSALFLHKSDLQGSIPSEIALLSSLTTLDFSDNKLEGMIPEALYDLTALEEVRLNENQLTGTISDKLAQLLSLTHLDLSDNEIGGSIPEIAPLEKDDLTLEYLNLSQNKLTGSIPENLVLPDLLTFDVGFNLLTGLLPGDKFVKTSSNLRNLHFSDNQFQGPLPESYLGIKKLETLKVNQNQLTGEVPAGGPATLSKYYLHGNLFSKPLDKDTCLLDITVEKAEGTCIDFTADCNICTCDLGGVFCQDC